MNDGLSGLFPIILVAMVGSLVASPLLTRIAVRAGLVDVPGSAPHKQHDRPTPMAGGPILAASIAAGMFLLRPELDRSIGGILGGALAMLLWGLFDDAVRMSPLAKLTGQVAVTVALIATGTQVHATQRHLLDLAITFLWVLGIVNAFNFVDSMDGLALGIGSIALAFFMLVTLDAGQPELAALSAAALGAALGLYFFNSSPARLFLGDSGAQLLGLVLAAIGIAYVPAGAGLPQALTWFTPILVLGVPIFDATLVVVSRLRRRLPIYQAQQDHTYHRLVALGLPPSRSVLTMHMVAILLGLVAFVALGMTVLVANIVFIGILLVGMLLAVYLERSFIQP